MQTLTEQEFKKKYGVIAASQFSSSKKEEGLFDEIRNAFSQGVGTMGQGINDATAKPGTGVGDLVGGVGRILGGAAQVATSPIAPVLNRTLGPAIDAAGEALSNVPAIKDAYQPIPVTQPGGGTVYNQPDQSQAEGFVEGVSNYANAAGLVGGLKAGVGAAPAVASKVGSVVDSIPKLPPGSAGAAARNVTGAVRDIVPTKQSLIDHNLAKALDLTPGDLSNIAKSTGNEVGTWMADNNLIGKNKANTQGLISSFFKQNYDAVRAEVGKVTQIYKAAEVPRFRETLNAIGAEIQGKLGLEGVVKEIADLLKKEEITLNDVQRAKELLDEHFNLYKVTGDVASGLAKEGLANVRTELKTFIENEVQRNTGADIRQMNNNVATAKSLGNAIEHRSPRGLTRANLTTRDIMMGMGLTYFASPLIGLAAILIKKIATSPTIRLRFARYLDGLNDAQRAKISEALAGGQVPKEIQGIVPLTEGEIPKTMPTLGSQKTLQAFGKSSDQTKIGPFELGSFGKNNAANKASAKDRFPISELKETQEHIKSAFNASSNPESYRSSNIAWVAKMPNGETRVIYTRINSRGKEEILNWHIVSDPRYIETLKTFGIPAETRTRILSLERSGSNPLNYGDI